MLQAIITAQLLSGGGQSNIRQVHQETNFSTNLTVTEIQKVHPYKDRLQQPQLS